MIFHRISVGGVTLKFYLQKYSFSSGAPFICMFFVLYILDTCLHMGEQGLYKRFLVERKRSVKAEVAKARKEYEGIVTHLQELMQQVFVQKFKCSLDARWKYG